LKRSLALEEIARQVLAAAELETNLELDLLLQESAPASLDFIHKQLRTRLSAEINAIESAGNQRIETARAQIRLALLDEINNISLDLLKNAQQGFSHLESTSVKILVNTNYAGESEALWPRELHEFVTIGSHGQALKAALRIRTYSTKFNG
jgi:hypothetical protein